MTTARHDITTIAFIGFGEAARAIGKGLQSEDGSLLLRAYDIKTDREMTAPSMRADYAAAGVAGAESAAEAVAGADIVFSTVTADQAGAAAETVAAAKLNGALFLDCNSCAPEVKRASAARIDAAGGRYVDVAVMAPVHPRLHRTPCLLSGDHAQDAGAAMRALGMDVQLAEGPVGAASTRKMVRSIMIKGLEALTVECMLAARKAGIEDDILASLESSFPGFGWAERAPYMLERVMTHGIRRAAEMREVARTVEDLGLAAPMAKATVMLQQEIGELGLDAEEIGAADLAALTDAIMAGLARRRA